MPIDIKILDNRIYLTQLHVSTNKEIPQLLTHSKISAANSKGDQNIKNGSFKKFASF
jgi:hypothetical protein